MRSNFYLSKEKLDDLLKSVGVKVDYETATDIIAYCCFHDNRDSPAFNMSKTAPYLWKCWNGKCGQRGNILTLLTKKGYKPNEAKRMLREGLVDADDFVEYIANLLKEEENERNDWTEVEPDRFRDEDRNHGYPARQYIVGRGISEEAYDFFRMGYSHKKRMLIIPIFDEGDDLVGVIGRSIEGKRYQYSSGLNRSNLIWNLNSIRKDHRFIVLTEGALDAVALWDKGVKNAGSVLGSSISDQQWRLMRKYFDGATAFFDNDGAGFAARDSLLDKAGGFYVDYVTYLDGEAKDPGELTGEQVSEMMANRKTVIDRIFEV